MKHKPFLFFIFTCFLTLSLNAWGSCYVAIENLKCDVITGELDANSSCRQEVWWRYFKLNLEQDAGFAVDSNGSIHRFEGTNGVYHWNGSTSDIKNPLNINHVPIEIRRKLGVR